VRVHAVNVLHDLLRVGGHGDSQTAVEQAMRAVEAEGRGVVVLIRDLRPKTVSDWVARRQSPSAEKYLSKERRQVEIGIGSQILRDLGVTDMVLLTTSPQHVYVGLEAFGLRVAGTRKIE
jgi:3,4-dihydroxy 2-butanone 4-phosphate synthase/GTP cyclohydrolase II